MRLQTAKCMNDHWQFHLGDLPPEALKSAGDLPWSRVDLPHSWNALDTMDVEEIHHYTRAVGWYMREVEPYPIGKRLWVEVEAASQCASIWLNGTYIGEHTGDYTAFTVELTSEQPESLTLTLRVDNLPDANLIPSDMSDFFLSGGLTRNVWCYISGLRRIASLRCEAEVSTETAMLTIQGQLDSPPPYPLYLDVELFSPQSTLVARATETITTETIALPTCVIQQPELWSPEHPTLYTLHVNLRDGLEIWDMVTDHLGLRFFAFPAGGSQWACQHHYSNQGSDHSAC